MALDFTDYYVKIYTKKNKNGISTVKKEKGRITHKCKDGCYKIYDNSVKHKFVRKIKKTDICHVDDFNKETFLNDPNKEFVVIIDCNSTYEDLTENEKNGNLFDNDYDSDNDNDSDGEFDEVAILDAIKEKAKIVKKRDEESECRVTKQRKMYLARLLRKINHPYAEQFDHMSAILLFEDLPPKCDNWLKDTITAICDDPHAVVEFPVEEWNQFRGNAIKLSNDNLAIL